MSIFVVELENNDIAIEFMEQTNKRLIAEIVHTKHGIILPNFINGKVKCLSKKEDLRQMYIVLMKPMFPKIYYIGLVLGLTPLLFVQSITWFMLPGALMFSTGIFWSKYFHYAALVLGIRKAKYKGKIKLTKNTHALEMFIT